MNTEAENSSSTHSAGVEVELKSKSEGSTELTSLVQASTSKDDTNAVENVPLAQTSTSNKLSLPNSPPSKTPHRVNPDLWVETKTSDGKSYYYHAISRETTWSRPEGLNVNIMTQAEIEAFNKQQTQQLPKTTEQSNVEYFNAPTAASVTVASTGTLPMKKTLPRFTGPPPTLGITPFGMPPPNFANFPPWNPPTINNTQGWMVRPVHASDVNKNAISEVELNEIDPLIVTKAAPWTEHSSPDGRTFYYNSLKGESVWEKPQALRDIERAKLAVWNVKQKVKVTPPVPPFLAPSITSQMPNMSNMPTSMSGVKIQQFPTTLSTTATGVAAFSALPVSEMRMQQLAVTTGSGVIFDPLRIMTKQDKTTLEEERKRKQEQEKKRIEEEEKAKSSKTQDKSRPIYHNPISGTPWCVVWTGDGRVFFYNPSTRTSVWERPEDLKNRPDVDKAVLVPPVELLGNIEKKENDTVSATVPTTAATITPGNSVTKIDTTSHAAYKAGSSDSRLGIAETDSSAEENVEPKSKKCKSEVDAALKSIQSVNLRMGNDHDKEDIVMEAEARAARERTLLPLDVRMKSFREMLREKDVSAFSTWEKELHKIVFDSRYLLLTSRERKQVFEKYVKDRADEERREKRNKIRQNREDFCRLLESAHLHGKSSFSEFAQRYGKDERFKVIEKNRDREVIFNEFIIDMRKREKEEKQNRKEQVRKNFLQMLQERSDINRHTRFSDVRKRLEGDVRYKDVAEHSLREELFINYIRMLKEEKRRTKEKETAKNNKNRNIRSDDKIPQKMLLNRSCDHRSRSNVREPGRSSKANLLEDTEASIEPGVADEEGEEFDTSDEDEIERQQKERDRKLRAEASIKEREKEVQRTLATHLRDRDKERQHHQRDEAIRHFNALLADLVRDADLTWKEVKKLLKKDHRWELISTLNSDDRERLFNEHTSNLVRKKRDKFREMLEEIQSLELTSEWKEIKKLIRDDPRYLKYHSSGEREFRDFIKDKTTTAKLAFRELLQECKLVTHKSLELYRENTNHLREIENILQNDRRYLVLHHIAPERTQMILAHLEELHKRGPPPPPTASESLRRK